MNLDLEDIIQPSWIQQQERLQNVDSVFTREPMTSISAKFLYINTHDYIEKIICEDIPLESHLNGSLITKERLIQIIQKKKIKTSNTKYKLLDSFLCNFDIPPSSIYSFYKNSSPSINSYMKNINIIEDLIISPSIFVFHDINTLFFIFQEHPVEKHEHTIKSILKPVSNSNHREPLPKNKQKTTKKVRIIGYNPIKPTKKLRKTKKHKII